MFLKFVKINLFPSKIEIRQHIKQTLKYYLFYETSLTTYSYIVWNHDLNYSSLV